MAQHTAPLTQMSAGRSAAVHRAQPRLSRRMAMLAGGGLLAIAATGAFGYIGVVQGLVSDGDAARTAAAISGSRGLFAAGVSAMYVAALLDVMVAWALLQCFEPIGGSIARLAAYLRIAYAAAFLVAISQLAGVPRILESGDGAFSTTQVQAQALARIETFHDVWFASLVLFGAHLAVLGVVVIRSSVAPRLIGLLLVVAGVGYLFDTFYDVLRPDATLTVSSVTFIGEFLLAMWLLTKGGRGVSSGASR